MKSSATVPTEHASRYMVQLCKHFGHKIPTEWNDHEGKITFAMGEVALRAGPETLMMVASAATPRAWPGSNRSPTAISSASPSANLT